MRDDRFLCIHGHFYQPPRENPWTGSLEPERSALPLHDWNERVAEECYKPCTAARILGEGERISELVNLFSRLSFNVGPTLMTWLEREAPAVYERILQADVESRQRYGGQGAAMAQAYNHMILPLADERDRRTQVRWGCRDFEHCFGRRPEGMWLPETAVDTSSLEALAAEGVRFTILAPYQAALVRPPDGDRMAPPGEGGLDPGVPYVQNLPSGRSIIVFYYDGPLSQAVAFDRLLDDGPGFASRLHDVACSGHGERRLTNIATDGESYGHHHRHGEMALAWTFRHFEASGGARPTVYGAYLDGRPPIGETRIADGTAWSCAHGVERWRSACGCSIGAGDPAGQSWRAPLREGLDALRDSLGSIFEREGGLLLRDPWEARDSWIDCVLDPAPERVAQFLADRSARDLDGKPGMRARALLEMQRNAMLMFTSCGWFFDDIGGIETRQILRYAGRALDLARLAGCVEPADRAETDFVMTLASARGREATGDTIYTQERDGCRTDLRSAAAHVALGAAADGGRGDRWFRGPRSWHPSSRKRRTGRKPRAWKVRSKSKSAPGSIEPGSSSGRPVRGTAASSRGCGLSEASMTSGSAIRWSIASWTLCVQKRGAPCHQRPERRFLCSNPARGCGRMRGTKQFGDRCVRERSPDQAPRTSCDPRTDFLGETGSPG